MNIRMWLIGEFSFDFSNQVEADGFLPSEQTFQVEEGLPTLVNVSLRRGTDKVFIACWPANHTDSHDQ